MGKRAFVFPGQGAQYIEMGKEFYEAFPVCREIFETASEASGLDIAALCFEENDKLSITEYTQIAMITVETAILRALEARQIKPDVTAGLSLGEYGALITSGVLEEKDAFALVRQRGIYMQEAVPTGGAMTAVLGLDAAKIEAICADTKGIVSVANYNCPGQTVISGEKAAVDAAAKVCREAGARGCVQLKVSGPFHSVLLEKAGTKLFEYLQKIELHPIKVPYIANVTADYVTDPGEIKPLLEKQISSPVKWQQSIERMIADGTDTFIEIGPGKTLTGFMKRINRSVKAYSIERPGDLESLSLL